MGEESNEALVSVWISDLHSEAVLWMVYDWAWWDEGFGYFYV